MKEKVGFLTPLSAGFSEAHRTKGLEAIWFAHNCAGRACLITGAAIETALTKVGMQGRLKRLYAQSTASIRVKDRIPDRKRA